MYLINFIASAIGKVYEDMIPPYIFFALKNNKGAFVEVIVEDSQKFIETYKKELNAIKDSVGDHFLVRNFSRPITYHMVNTYRFLEVPTVKAKYTYICDIDIMLLENVVDYYLKTWPSSTNLPYNNIIRRGTYKITGVHFVITDEYYTDALIENQQRIYNAPFMNDEEALYYLCAMTFGLPDVDYYYRPILGIHFSPNRGDGKIMNLVTSFKYRDLFLKTAAKYGIFKMDLFKRLTESLNHDFKIGTRVVYTALFTDPKNPSDKIQEFERLPDWDYILFTNLDIKSSSWTVRKIPLPDKDYIVSAKMVKWLSHEYLPEFDIVCWVDAYCCINNKHKDLLDSYINKLENAAVPLFIKAHPDRSCIYDEVNACISKRKINLENYKSVKSFLIKNKMPQAYGLYETNLMVRLNNNADVIKISKELIKLIQTLTYRDQLVLTYVLFKNGVDKLNTIDKSILQCNGKDARHKYVDKVPIRVAVCFWGLMRSLTFTLPSIKQYIFKPLDDANIEYDIFLHTFNLNGDCSSTYPLECAKLTGNNEFKLLNPKECIIENQNEIDAKIGLQKYTKMGNPWRKAPIETLYNHIRALWSLKRVTSIWSRERSKYSHVIYCRPDMTYIMPIDVDWLKFSDEIVTPDFARHGRNTMQICDRFAIGMPEQMEVYGNRFDQALAYSRRRQLHSETFLAYTLNSHNIRVKYVAFAFLRTRANALINISEDIPEAIRRKWYTRKLARDTQANYTRKARKLGLKV